MAGSKVQNLRRSARNQSKPETQEDTSVLVESDGIEADDRPDFSKKAAVKKATSANPALAAEDAQLTGQKVREDEEAAPGQTSADEDSTGPSDGDGANELDAFEKGTREAVDAFEAAIAEPAAFLRPNTTISELARKAAKVLSQNQTAPYMNDMCLGDLCFSNPQMWHLQC
jgi:hypothetical protein